VFTTVRPNFSVATYDDFRFDFLCDHFSPQTSFPSQLRVVDCPGLIRGSSHGNGVGVEHITKNCGNSDCLMVVLRAFGGNEITQVGDGVNPLRDLDLILEELVAIDLQILMGNIAQMKPLVDRKQGGSQMAAELRAINTIDEYLKETKKPVRLRDWNDQEVDIIRKLKLLTAKEIVVVVNMDIRDYVRSKEVHNGPTSIMSRIRHHVTLHHGMTNAVSMPYSGKFEEKIRLLGGDEAIRAYFAANPTHHPCRHALMKNIFKSLQLVI
jgi:obg-like ATPase 1